MDSTDKSVIENVLTRMKSARMSQKSLAKAAGLNYEGLNRILNFHSPPSRSTIKALADALGCTVDELRAQPPIPLRPTLEQNKAVKEIVEFSYSASARKQAEEMNLHEMAQYIHDTEKENAALKANIALIPSDLWDHFAKATDAQWELVRAVFGNHKREVSTAADDKRQKGR